jgi:flagellar motor protein MotB
VANGVEAKRISTLGRGELEPLQSNRTQEGREANRRIEVKLSY